MRIGNGFTTTDAAAVGSAGTGAGAVPDADSLAAGAVIPGVGAADLSCICRASPKSITRT